MLNSISKYKARGKQCLLIATQCYDKGGKVVFFAALFAISISYGACKNRKISTPSSNVDQMQIQHLFDSIRIIDLAIASNPLQPINYYIKGALYESLKDYDSAYYFYSLCIKIDGSNSSYYHTRGRLLFKRQKFAEALIDYDSAIFISDVFFEYYNDRGVVKEKLREFASAIADYDTSIMLNPEWDLPYYNRGVAYLYLEKAQLAIQDFDVAIRKNNKRAEYYFNRGAAYFKLNQLDKACADLNRSDALGYKKAKEIISLYCE